MAADPMIVEELGRTDLFAGIRKKALKAIASAMKSRRRATADWAST